MVNHFTEGDVIHICLAPDSDLELLVQQLQFLVRHHALQLQLAQHAPELWPRYVPIVHPVKVLEQGEELHLVFTNLDTKRRGEMIPVNLYSDFRVRFLNWTNTSAY